MQASTPHPFSVARAYLDLTKPRLLPMVLFTALPVMGMAAGGWPPLARASAVLVGITLAAAAANALNALVEREQDARMARTRERPLPSGRLAPPAALRFGLVLAVLSTALLYAVSGLAAATLGVASILFYVFVYTLWAKPRTASSTLVGAVAGAVSPLIADVAVNGHVGLPGLTLFAIVFFWQPPHVWAITLYLRDDYRAAGIPMPPEVIGEDATRRRMLRYTIGLVPVTLAPAALGLLGPLYAVAAAGLCGWFVAAAVRVLRERSDEAARSMFRVSLVFLFGVFLAMLADLLLQSPTP
jgi:protoheme IX farnesyltransferase